MTGFDRLSKDGTEHQSSTLKTFTPRGYRTRPLNYERGMSGKQSAMRFPENPTKPIVLLVMDSNGRNVVKPQKVNPSPHTSFDLAAISIPGGKTFHACTELRHLSKCDHKVSHVVLSLGTNDMSEGPQVLTRFSSRVENLIRVAQDVYPDANISYVSVLPRHDEFSDVVPEANKLILQIMQYFQLPFISISVPDDPWNWSDLIHLSDAGLKLFMQNFETEVETKLFGNPNFKPAKVTPKFKRFSSSYSVTSFESRRSGLKRHSSCATSLSFNAKRPSLEKESKDLRLDCNETWPSLGTSNRFDVLSENTKEEFTDETSIDASEEITPTSKKTSRRTISPWSNPTSTSRKTTASSTASSQDSNSQSSKSAPRQKPSPWAPTSARRLSNSMESKLQSFKLEKSRLKRQNLDGIVPSSSSCAPTPSCDLSKSIQARTAFPKPIKDSIGQKTFGGVNNQSRGATKNRLVPWQPGNAPNPPAQIKFKISSTKQPVGRPRKIDPGFIPKILSLVTNTKRTPTSIQNDLTGSSRGDDPKETPVGLVWPITQKPHVTNGITPYKSEGRLSSEPQTHATRLTPIPNTFEPQVPASGPHSISVVISPSRQCPKVTRRTPEKETCRWNAPRFGSDDTNVSDPSKTGVLAHPIGVISPIAKHPAPHMNRNFKATNDTTEIGGNLHQIEVISPIRPAPVVPKSTDCGIISPIVPRRLFDSTMTGSFETTFSDEFRGQRSSLMVHNTCDTMSGFGATMPHNENLVYPADEDPQNVAIAGGQRSHFADPEISRPLAFARPRFLNSEGHGSSSMAHDSNNDVFYFNSVPQKFNSNFTPNQDSRYVWSSQGQRSQGPSYKTNEPTDYCAPQPQSSNVPFSPSLPDFRNVIVRNPCGQGSNDPRNISVPGILGHNSTQILGVCSQSNRPDVQRKVVNQIPWGQRSCGVIFPCSRDQQSNEDGGNAPNVQRQAPAQFWGHFPSDGVPDNSRHVMYKRSYSPSRIVESRESVGQCSTQYQPAYFEGNTATMFGMAQAPSTNSQGSNFTPINDVVTSRGALQCPLSIDSNAVIETVRDPDVMVTSHWGWSQGSSFEWGQKLNSQLNGTITDDDMNLFRETTIKSERSFESIGSNSTPGKKKRQSLKLYQPPQTRTPESPSKSKKRKSLEFSRPSKPRTPDDPNKHKNRPLVEINATHRAYCGIFTPKSHHTKLCNVFGTARYPGLFAGPADFVVSTKETPSIDRLAQTF